MISKLLRSAVLPVALGAGAACASGTEDNGGVAQTGGPRRSVTVENCGEDAAYEGVPWRVVTNETPGVRDAGAVEKPAECLAQVSREKEVR